MTPVEIAKRLLGDSWLEDLEAHLLGGFVISTPDAFLIGRPVPHGAEVVDAWEQWPREESDCWFVWCAAGDPRRLLDLMPFPLPWIGWMRLGRGWREIHWIRASRLRVALAGTEGKAKSRRAACRSLRDAFAPWWHRNLDRVAA